MRIAAGILMIVAAIIGISFTRSFFGNIPGLLGSLPSILLVFVFPFVCVGVYYTLKRKHWGVCLAASILSGGSADDIHLSQEKRMGIKRLLLVLLVSLVLLVGCVGAIKEIPAPPGPPSPPPPGVEYVYPEESSAPSAPKSAVATASTPTFIEVDENGLSINKNKFNMDSTLDDYIRVLGNPSRVTELMNTIHTYDDAGIMLYHPPHSNEIISISIDFARSDYEFSPKHAFSGILVIGGSNIQTSSSLDSLKSINALTVDDSSFGVHRGYLGDTILIFEYVDSIDKLAGIGISFSESSITTGPTPLEDGWVRLRIEDVGSIDYPPDFLELQSQDYRDMGKGIYQLLEDKTDFTLQQAGLNELNPSSFNEYRRVTFRTTYLNPGEEVFRVNEKDTMSQEELAEFQNELIDQQHQAYAKLKNMGLGDNKIVGSNSIEIAEVNGMFPLVHTYKRQLNDNPVVLAKAYMFQNYDRIHNLTLSYRVVDEEECRYIFDKILDSFRLE